VVVVSVCVRARACVRACVCVCGHTRGAQAIANIMNALVRLDFAINDLSTDMAEAALRVPPKAFDTQAVSVIVNALAKAGVLSVCACVCACVRACVSAC
jgi:hypothetical protein